MITLKQAKTLKVGDILLDEWGKRWKVTGKVKLWKRPENAHRIQVPLKHGLYAYATIDELDFDTYGKCHSLTKEVNK